MSTEAYESRTDSVLAWKKTQKLGRFDPNAPEIEKSKIEASFQEVEARGTFNGLTSIYLTNHFPSPKKHLPPPLRQPRIPSI